MDWMARFFGLQKEEGISIGSKKMRNRYNYKMTDIIRNANDEISKASFKDLYVSTDTPALKELSFKTEEEAAKYIERERVKAFLKKNVYLTSIMSDDIGSYLIKDIDYYIALLIEKKEAGKLRNKINLKATINDLNGVKKEITDSRVAFKKIFSRIKSDTYDMQKLEKEKYYYPVGICMETENMTRKLYMILISPYLNIIENGYLSYRIEELIR